MSNRQELIEKNTLTELKKKAVEAGMDEAVVKSFTTKAQVAGLITIIESKKEEKIDISKAAEETPVEAKKADKAWISKAMKMGKILESQPKVGIMIPLEPTEKPGDVENRVVDGIREFKVNGGAIKEKIINGYKWVIPKGIMSMVPQQVYELVSKEMNILSQLGKQHSLDRVDPETGKTVGSALS